MSAIRARWRPLWRPALLGGIDGTITSFAVVAGGDAGGLGVASVLAVGASSVVADGFSMGVSEYASVSQEIVDTAVGLGSGVACFLSFLLFGFVPLAVYVLTDGVLLSCAFFGVAELVVLGALAGSGPQRDDDDGKGGEPPPLLASVVRTTALGSAAGAIAYAVGLLAAE